MWKLSGVEFKTFIFLLALASEENKEGKIVMSIKDISKRIRVPSWKVSKTIKKLYDLNIIMNTRGAQEEQKKCTQGAFSFLNWNKRQYSKEYLYVKRYRERHKIDKDNDKDNDKVVDKGYDNDMIRRDTETDTETEQIQINNNAQGKTTHKNFDAIFQKEFRLKYKHRPLKMAMRIKKDLEGDFKQILQNNPKDIENFISCYLEKFKEEKYDHTIIGFIYNFHKIVRLTPKYLEEKEKEEEINKAIAEVKDG